MDDDKITTTPVFKLVTDENGLNSKHISDRIQINNYTGAFPGKGFNRDLVSIDERKQDNALREYYGKLTITSAHKRNILNGCIMFSRRIKPVVALIFVTWYWYSGLNNYMKMEYNL